MSYFSSLNPRTTAYEWMGPSGAVMMVLGLPFTILAINTFCGPTSCSVSDAKMFLNNLKGEFSRALPALFWAFVVESMWLVAHALFYLVPIGKRVNGMKLRNGQVLSYQINAIYTFILYHVGIAGLHYYGIMDMGIIVDNFFALAIMAIIISFCTSVVLYVVSFRKGALLALGGNSGNCFYDFWVGRELNPRIGDIDLKLVSELRPGLIGWSLINWAYVVRAYQSNTSGPGIFAIAFLDSLYIFDALIMEEGNLTMMDMVHDGFGFMLCFGNFAWVPFLYTLKTRFLFYYPQKLSYAYITVCVILYMIGYFIFRAANSQKDIFRKNPQDTRMSHLKVMKTRTGKSLIISGFWGVCRHPNYVGDWIMMLALSFLTGYTYSIPYFQLIYFSFLLIHRQLRDEMMMKKKYGKTDWDAFCMKVPYRLIPYVY